jgi:hypothetical protein
VPAAARVVSNSHIVDFTATTGMRIRWDVGIGGGEVHERKQPGQSVRKGNPNWRDGPIFGTLCGGQSHPCCFGRTAADLFQPVDERSLRRRDRGTPDLSIADATGGPYPSLKLCPTVESITYNNASNG